MNTTSDLPKSVFYGFLAISMAVLAADFLFVYIPLSGWILQALLVGIYLEYLGVKKTMILVAVLEIFFMASYGGAVALSAILSILSTRFIVPIIIGLYFLVLGVGMLLGLIAHYLFHKIHLFERLSQKTTKHHKSVLAYT